MKHCQDIGLHVFFSYKIKPHEHDWPSFRTFNQLSDKMSNCYDISLKKLYICIPNFYISYFFYTPSLTGSINDIWPITRWFLLCSMVSFRFNCNVLKWIKYNKTKQKHQQNTNKMQKQNKTTKSSNFLVGKKKGSNKKVYIKKKNIGHSFYLRLNLSIFFPTVW